MNNNSLLPAEYSFVNVNCAGERTNNIWVKSFSFWVALGYLALIIIRPWEVLFPSLAVLHFERIYVIVLIVNVFLVQKKQPAICFQTVAVGAFFLALVICTFAAFNTSKAWDVLYVYLALVIFYHALIVTVHTPYSLFFAVEYYIFIMALYLGKAQWEFWVHGQHRYDMGVVRLVGIEESYGGPNALAMSIVVSLPFALFLWRHRKEITLLWPNKWVKRNSLLLKSYALLAICSIAMTNSRSGMVSFVFFLLLLFTSTKGFLKKIGFAFAGLIFLGFLWLAMPAEIQGRLSTIWAPEEGPSNAQVSAEGRIEGFKAGMDMFYKHPVAGVGLGNFVEYRVAYLDGIPLQAHNLAGQVLGELGLVGAISFLFMVFATFDSCRRIKKMARERMLDPGLWVDFATACRDSILLLFFTGLFGHNMLRYNWLFAAAFAVKGVYFLKNTTCAMGVEVSHANRKDL